MIRRFLLAAFLSAAGLAASGAMAQPSTQDCKVAVKAADDEWLSSDALAQCAVQGDRDAEALLGMIYWGASASEVCDRAGCIEGDPAGVNLDPALSQAELRREGLRLLESAAGKGQFQAQNELGLAYLEGNYGIMPDLAKARTWLEKSSEGGDTISPFNLARLYFGGLGTERSVEKGEHYLRMSALRGYKPARCALTKYLEDKGDPNGTLLRWTVMAGVRCWEDEFIPELFE